MTSHDYKLGIVFFCLVFFVASTKLVVHLVNEMNLNSQFARRQYNEFINKCIQYLNNVILR